MEWTEQLSVLFANAADGVYVSDPQGRIVFWNRAAEALMGFPAQEMVGKACRDVFCGRDTDGNRLCNRPCPVQMRLRGEEPVRHFHMATKNSAGEPLWIDVSCIPLPNDDAEQPPTSIMLFRDVTAQHQIEHLVRKQLVQTRSEPTREALALDALSPRELDVVKLMRSGLTTRAIAETLFISRATVRNHIQHILDKLNVHTRLEAVAYVNQLAQRGVGPAPQPNGANTSGE